MFFLKKLELKTQLIPDYGKFVICLIMQVKEFFTNFYDSIYDEDI